MATAAQIISVARGEIGTKENPLGSDKVKYNTEYYGYEAALPWCAVFVWWVFKHANASSLFYGGSGTASVNVLYNYYNGKGMVYMTPKVGDIAIYSSPSFNSHTAIVSEVNGNAYKTIDGNSTNQVKENSHTVGDGAVFCRPAYDGSSSGGGTGTGSGTTTQPTLSSGSTGSAVKTMQKKLMMLGFSCGSAGADGDFGSGTLTAVKNFQAANGLSVDGICGSATHAKLDAKYNALGVFTATCNLQDLKVRTGAGTEYPIFTQYPKLNKGETVLVAKKVVVQTTPPNWYFALVGDRYTAYVSARYMK